MKEVVDNIDFKKINSIEINSYNTVILKRVELELLNHYLEKQ